MKKNGFTLIEILGIVVILGVLLLLITPPVINQISSKKDDVTKLQEEMIKDAVNLYLDSHDVQAGYCIPVSELNANIKDATTGETLNKFIRFTSQSYEIVDGCS